MAYTISDLMGLYQDCQAGMRSALIYRKHPDGPHFGILSHDDPLARLYQKRNRFAKNLAARIRAHGAALEAENEQQNNRIAALAGAVAMLAAENAQLRAELSACIAGGNDYTGAILADDEAGMMLGVDDEDISLDGADDDLIIQPPANFAANGFG